MKKNIEKAMHTGTQMDHLCSKRDERKVFKNVYTLKIYRKKSENSRRISTN